MAAGSFPSTPHPQPYCRKKAYLARNTKSRLVKTVPSANDLSQPKREENLKMELEMLQPKLGTVPHARKPSAWEAGTGGCEVQGLPGIPRGRPCFKNQKRITWEAKIRRITV
jgi:hypothetical protein